MLNQLPPPLREWPETDFSIELRSAERYPCLESCDLPALVKPGYGRQVVRIRDISATGMGLLCSTRLWAGNRLALLWKFGPPHRHRTLVAVVAHVTPHASGDWQVGCRLDQPLPAEDLHAFLQQTQNL